MPALSLPLSTAAVLTSAALLTALACATREHPRTELAIEHVNVVDVERGTLLPDRTVVIRDGRIASVDTAPNVVTRPARLVDGRGKYLMPGLWDMHTHVDDGAAWIFPASVAMGITGMRDLGSTLERVREWRNDTLGKRAPRVVAAGPIIMGVTNDTDPRVVAVRTGEEARRVVDSLGIAGVDLIKVYDWVTVEAYRAIADAARARGLAVVGHLPIEVDPDVAIAAGHRSIEHDGNAEGGLLLHASRDARKYLAAARANVGKPFNPAMLVGSWAPAEIQRFLDSFDEVRADSIARALARGGVFVTPTVYSYSSAWLLPPDSALLRAPGRDLLPNERGAMHDAMVREYHRSPPATSAAAAHARLYDVRARLVRSLHRSGVLLLAGTDLAPYPGGFPGYALHNELAELQSVGLSPSDALRAATLNPARYFAADTMGVLRVGTVADLVLLNANPLADVRNTLHIEAIVLRGELIDRAARTALVEEARRSASSAR